jgi:hypothetical protein
MFLALSALSLLLTLGSFGLPMAPSAPVNSPALPRTRLNADETRVLLAMALFTFGSLAIWPFMERAAHAIGMSAVEFGRFQSVATLASALGNVVLAVVVGRIRNDIAVSVALLTCGVACVVLTTASGTWVFALALIAYNVAWFVSYPLLLGIAYRLDDQGRLPVLCSAVWLLMTSFSSLITGVVAQTMGGYGPIGPLGLLFCALAAVCAAPLARRVNETSVTSFSAALTKTH